MLENIKALVFDLDDTLYLQRHFKISGFIAVAEWLEETYSISSNRTLRHLSCIMEIHGPSYPFFFDKLVQQIDFPKIPINQLVEKFRQHDPDIHFFPGVMETLIEIKQQYLIGILTDGVQETQRKKVHALNLHKIVDKILYSDDMKLSKPNEILYVTLEKSFQCSGKELVYIGDNPNKDFIGAKKRGWHTIRVLTGEFANQVVSTNLDGDFSLNNLSELPSLLH